MACTARQGPHCRCLDYYSRLFFARQRPKYRQGRAPSGILQVANLGVGHRMQRRNQHTTTTTTTTTTRLGGWRWARRQSSHLGGPPRHLSVASGPLTHRAQDKVRGEQGGRWAGLLCVGRLAGRSTTHGTACDSTSRRAIRQVMACHVPVPSRAHSSGEAPLCVLSPRRTSSSRRTGQHA